jgi:phage tail sheath gpL-like
MAVLKLKVSTARPVAYLTSTFQTAGGNRAIAQRLEQYLMRVASGNELALSASVPPQIVVDVQDNEVQASGTITFSAAASANDTVLINGVTFTAKASGAGANEFNVGASATASAANLAAAINASVTALVSGYVTATSALGVLTVKSAFYGKAGNQCTIAEGVDSGNVMTVSGARLTGGAADAGELTLNF